MQVIVKRPRHHQFLVDAYFKTENNFKSSYLKSFLLTTIIATMFLVGCNNPTKTENQIEVVDSTKTDEHEGRTTGVIDPNYEYNDSLPTNNTKSYQKTNKKQ